MSTLRKNVLISNLINNLKYKVKNNNDKVNLLFIKLKYCKIKNSKYYLDEITKIQNINFKILNVIKSCNKY